MLARYVQLAKDRGYATRWFFCYLKEGLVNQRVPGKGFTFRLKTIFRGFWPDTYYIYQTTGYPIKNFLSDYKRIVKLSMLNKPNHYIFADKLVFENFFPQSIKSLGLIEGGFVYHWGSESSIRIEEYIRDFPSRKRLFIKPRRGGGGGGAYIIEKNGIGYKLSGQQKSYPELLNKIRDCNNYLLYDCCKQRGFSHEIFPDTLNTIRVLSIIDPQNKQPVIIRAIHRFGTYASIPVDNWSSGGLSCNINIKTGELSRGVKFPSDGKLTWYDRHPDTGRQLEGSIIPSWDKIIEFTKQHHRHVPFLPYIGWDFALDNDKIIIIEGNANSGVDGIQVHEPLLVSEAYVNFLKNSRYSCA
ncbi:MAG: sugar-transfer associated ATP-grasp domain-containing protein [Bacteroidales bacterium]